MKQRYRSSAPIVFVASVLVKNIGERTVTAVQWAYLLFEAELLNPLSDIASKQSGSFFPTSGLNSSKK
jgi:hypothetical protein